eukprot:3785580-Ditylum_brightwellii.AAC.1
MTTATAMTDLLLRTLLYQFLALHCMGFSHDCTGDYQFTLNCYDEALNIQSHLLDKDDLQVAKRLHNKDAILCEEGYGSCIAVKLMKAVLTHSSGWEME